MAAIRGETLKITSPFSGPSQARTTTNKTKQSRLKIKFRVKSSTESKAVKDQKKALMCARVMRIARAFYACMRI